MEQFQVANTIFQQLGGNRFAVMTGAAFILRDDGLNLKLPARLTKNGINVVRITLMPTDTYSVSFEKITTRQFKQLSEHHDVYCDEIRELFERETGMATRI